MSLQDLWLGLGERLSPILLDLLNRNIAVFLLLLVALMLRFLFLRGPKWVRMLLWGLIALRLLLPLHVSASLSFLGHEKIPVSETGQVEFIHLAENADVRPARPFPAGDDAVAV